MDEIAIPIIIFGTAFGLIVLHLLRRLCYKWCSEDNSSEEPIQVQISYTPNLIPGVPSVHVSRPAPATPSIPVPAHFEDPPPYSEVAFKPNIWPLIDQLPSYDNIAMENHDTSEQVSTQHGQVATKC